MSNPVMDEILLVCEVLEVFVDFETQEVLKKIVPSISRFQPFPAIKNILNSIKESNPGKQGLISENISVLDEIILSRLQSPGLNIYETIFGILNRVSNCSSKSWNQTPSRSKILNEIKEISENYLTTAFTIPEMFSEGIVELRASGFESFSEVLERKKKINSKQLMQRLQSENYTKDLAQKAVDFLKLASRIDSIPICNELFKVCCESNENFSVGKIIFIFKQKW
jgi:hypothetical protein